MLSLLLLMMFSGQSTEAATLGAKSSFCVQTFNVYGAAYAPKKSIRTRQIAASLKDSPCEVIQLQEVWTPEIFKILNRELNSHQKLWHGTNFNEVVPVGATHAPGRIGLSTFSSVRPSSIESIVFPVNYDVDGSALGSLDWVRERLNVKKAFSITKIQVLPGQDVYFVNTHLHPLSQRVRLAQTLKLLRTLESLLAEDVPIILSGDFNADPDSIEMRLIRDVFLTQDVLGARNECTYCSENPLSLSFGGKDNRMDYIYSISSSTKKIQVLSAKVNMKTRLGVPLSDHYGLQARFEILTDEKVSQATDPTVRLRRKQAMNTLLEAMELLRNLYESKEYRTAYLEAFAFYTELKHSDERSSVVNRLFFERP